jgi:hypothetical protein
MKINHFLLTLAVLLTINLFSCKEEIPQFEEEIISNFEIVLNPLEGYVNEASDDIVAERTCCTTAFHSLVPVPNDVNVFFKFTNPANSSTNMRYMYDLIRASDNVVVSTSNGGLIGGACSNIAPQGFPVYGWINSFDCSVPYRVRMRIETRANASSPWTTCSSALSPAIQNPGC